MKHLSTMRSFFLVLGLALLAPADAFSDPSSDQNMAAIEQAKRDYQAYLEGLKALSSQYKQVTEAVREVIKDEGVPSWNEETGEIEVGGFKRTTLGHSFVDVDIQNGDKDMTVKADLPGVQKDKIQVTLKDEKTLRVSGESHSAKRTGPFERLIELPAKAKAKGIQATYENGVLTVVIPKETQSPQEIPIPVR